MKTTRRRNASWLLRTRKNTHTPAALYERFEPEEARRIANKLTINWQFTTADARIKLKRLYPEIRQESVT